MILKRIYNERLAQASYLVGCQLTGVALIVDPLRDTTRYLAAAAEERVTITHVTETHIHADFVSGAHDLAAETGARVLLSDMGGPDWSYARAGEWGADLLRDGSAFTIGEVRIDVLHTPGHTPEHLTFFVTDTASAAVPMGALTGDFIFVGDVGRPDLLERAAGIEGTKETAARTLFRSLQEFKKHPDYLQLWPGHGAGSACGKALGAMPQTTLGYERMFNWGLAETNEEAFVRHALEGQSDPPAYFAVMKAMNRDGPPEKKPSAPRDLSSRMLIDSADRGAIIVDTRPAAQFAEQHVKGTINIPFTRSFLKWSGALLPYDRDIAIIAEQGTDPASIASELSLIGIDRISGIYQSSMKDLESRGAVLIAMPQISAAQLANNGSRNGLVVIDVRNNDEWDEGHIPGAIHLPLVSLESRISELPEGAEIAVHCQGGGRSAIAASVLEKNGWAVSNVDGGYREWERAGGAVEKGSAQIE